jgi:uroporphyrin-3 C-methyltransferase
MIRPLSDTSMKQNETPESPDQKDSLPPPDAAQEVVPERGKRSRLLPLVLILLLLLLGGLGAAGWFGWQQWQALQAERGDLRQRIEALDRELQQRARKSELEQALRPLQQSVGSSDERLGNMEQSLQALKESTEKLYELYGRDENGWKLAEVEYLMSVAQHKLVLENDFEGAARTLQAASERIADLADPGLLPVRVQINREIAALKTRARPDLVGLSLLAARLTRQIRSLKPGYQPVEPASAGAGEPAEAAIPDAGAQRWDRKALAFLRSLVRVKRNDHQAEPVEQTLALDVAERIEDNLKLIRWAILDRDDFQYRKLVDETVTLFEKYYDREQAANADFHRSLLRLKQAELEPALPDISGSLRLLKEIEKRREQAPETGAGEARDETPTVAEDQ